MDADKQRRELEIQYLSSTANLGIVRLLAVVNNQVVYDPSACRYAILSVGTMKAMADTLRFRFNVEKFVNAVAYLSKNCPDSTKLSICKHLYFADKEHLLRYGRPIVGDQYYKLPHGPVPSHGLDMLRGKASAPELALLDKYVSVEGNAIRPKRDPDRKVFSKTDIEILDWVIGKYGNWPPSALRNESHRHAAWNDSQDSSPIGYELFFDNCPSSEDAGQWPASQDR